MQVTRSVVVAVSAIVLTGCGIVSVKNVHAGSGGNSVSVGSGGVSAGRSSGNSTRNPVSTPSPTYVGTTSHHRAALILIEETLSGLGWRVTEVSVSNLRVNTQWRYLSDQGIPVGDSNCDDGSRSGIRFTVLGNRMNGQFTLKAEVRQTSDNNPEANNAVRAAFDNVAVAVGEAVKESLTRPDTAVTHPAIGDDLRGGPPEPCMVKPRRR